MYTKELKQYSELSNVNLAWHVEEIIWFLMNYRTHVHKLITNSTELRISCAATQALPYIFWRPSIHYCTSIHKSSPLIPILSSTNPVNTTPSYLILSTHLHLCLPSGLFPSGFPTSNLYAFPPPSGLNAQPTSSSLT
jgi:hypothetical protein